MSTVKDTALGGIYQIRCKINNKSYVGSAKRFDRRWTAHRTALKSGKHHSRRLQNAWDKHGADMFVFEILEVVADKARLVVVEQEYLDRLQPWQQGSGYNICRTAGSCLGIKLTAEHRANISKAGRGRKFTAEHKARIGAAQRGRKLSPDRVAKSSAAQRGKPRRPHTPEELAKIRESAKNRSEAYRSRNREMLTALNRSPEQRARTSARCKGRRLTPECKAKISATLTGQVISDETRAKLSAAHKGKPKSPEMRAKLSATRRRIEAERRRKATAVQLSLDFGDTPPLTLDRPD